MGDIQKPIQIYSNPFKGTKCIQRQHFCWYAHICTLIVNLRFLEAIEHMLGEGCHHFLLKLHKYCGVNLIIVIPRVLLAAVGFGLAKDDCLGFAENAFPVRYNPNHALR
eukprot:1338640-Amorphochlora_amoeboformis.AAC.1